MSRGLTLVELLIALALGSFLSLAALQLILQSRLSGSNHQELGRMQENGRYALRLLARELEMAGFMAGSPLAPRGADALAGSACYQYLLAAPRALEVVSASSGSLPEDCLPRGAPLPGSDVIVVRRTLDRPHYQNGEFFWPLVDATVYLHNHRGVLDLEPGRNLGAGLAGSLWQYQPQLFFLRNYSIQAKDGIPTLCRKRLSPNRAAMAPAECLVEGIEGLRVIADGGRPGLVRLQLDLRSLGQLAAGVGSAPGFHRRTLSTSVYLRNASESLL